MFDIQPDEDQADPDERHDPDSDMEMDDHQAVEESSQTGREGVGERPC